MIRNEIIKIVKEERGKSFCRDEADKALKWLCIFPKEATEIEVIQDLTNPCWAYCWAKDIGTYKNEMAQVIIESEDGKWAYLWAKYVGTHQNEMVKVVVKGGNPQRAYRWAYYIGTHKNEMVKVVSKFGNAEWIYRWAKNIGTPSVYKALFGRLK